MNPTDPADEILCPCSGTTRARICQLHAQGFDIDAISRKTGAISGCGGCEWDISELLNALAEQRGKGAQASER
jgi:NAD(P)H-nitrite reductase large subunit